MISAIGINKITPIIPKSKSKILLIILFAAALVAVCWMLMEYWLGTRGFGMNGEIGRLRFGSRTAFALAQFWKRVDEAKDIPDEPLKREMGLADNGLPSGEK